MYGIALAVVEEHVEMNNLPNRGANRALQQAEMISNGCFNHYDKWGNALTALVSALRLLRTSSTIDPNGKPKAKPRLFQI